MAVVADGSQKFGLSSNTVTMASVTFVVESFSKTETSTRVDLDNSDGEPIGSTIVPGRTDFSATVQVGAQTATPTVGSEVEIADHSGSATYLITEAAIQETQAEYQRINISGYKKLN